MHISNQPPNNPATETLLPLNATPWRHPTHLPQKQPASASAPAPVPAPALAPALAPKPARPSNPHLYFAYGSNLSPTQMSHRCTVHPSYSAKPRAIGILHGWRWHINEAGYANVLPPVPLRVGAQKKSGIAEGIPVSGDEDVVFGVLYAMDAADERILDGYEGVDLCAGEVGGVRPEKGDEGDEGDEEDEEEKEDEEGGMVYPDPDIRPREQGEGDYNKWYVNATVVKWLDEETRQIWTRAGRSHSDPDLERELEQDEIQDESQKQKHPSAHHLPLASPELDKVRVLVYVDEERVRASRPKAEYIPRMHRAIREAAELGVSKRWLGDVVRRFIPEEWWMDG